MDPATAALRSGSADVLERNLIDTIVSGESEWLRDDRDFMVALAPFHDCARRLRVDPAELFARAAEQSPPPLRETVRTFGERTDVSLPSFAWKLEKTRDGPAYRSTMMEF